MNDRRYYSTRTGKDPKKLSLDLPMLQRLLYSTYVEFLQKDYFQEALGYDCVDAGEVYGLMGADPAMYAARRLRQQGLFPIRNDVEYTEDNLFDLIEFVYDHISKPVDGTFHSYSNCGYHYTTFDRTAGQNEFRMEVNDFLQDYGEGWEISLEGEMLAIGQPGLQDLFNAAVPSDDPTNIKSRVEAAISKFRRHRSSVEDRSDAVRDLAAVLEYLRPEARRTLTRRDEADLFELANRFGIRHHNQGQQTDYDHNIWLSWAFYYYLATIHALLRIIERSNA